MPERIKIQEMMELVPSSIRHIYREVGERELANINATSGLINFTTASVLCDASLKQPLTSILTTQ